MIELIQFPWTPFCIVIRRMLEYSRAPFKITNIPNGDRSLIWKLTKEQYYGVPVIRDGANVVFERDHDSQVIARYLDAKLKLDLFPGDAEGLQTILWGYIENTVEDIGFRLNDIYWEEMVAPKDRLLFLRHKERKFGRGCIDQWRRDQKEMVAEFARRILPFEEMLRAHRFLLGERPRFVDFDLCGMLGNYLHSGHYQLPRAHARLRQWYEMMGKVDLATISSEKLRS